MTMDAGGVLFLLVGAPGEVGCWPSDVGSGCAIWYYVGHALCRVCALLDVLKAELLPN